MFGKNIKITAIVVLLSFFLFEIVSSQLLTLKESQAAALGLPEPTQLLSVSKDYSLPLLKGIKLDPQNPLNFEFYIDTENKSKVTKKESALLINYFLAGLVVPAHDLWVNLSPYEQNRIIPDSLGATAAGKELLAQDYILKQLSSSLTYPKTSIGKAYWDVIGTTFMTSAVSQTNNLNKVWVVPGKSSLIEKGRSVFIAEARLIVKSENTNRATNLLIPKITADVNYGRNFAKLRQVYYSLVLATWFKEKFKESLYRHYIDSNKSGGFELEDRTSKEKIYELYCESFKKGVYDLIMKDQELKNKDSSTRKYFSGGAKFINISSSINKKSVKENEKITSYVDGNFVKVFGIVRNQYAKQEIQWPKEPRGDARDDVENWVSYFFSVKELIIDLLPNIRVAAFDINDEIRNVSFSDWFFHGVSNSIAGFRLVEFVDDLDLKEKATITKSINTFNTGVLMMDSILTDIENDRLASLSNAIQTKVSSGEPLSYIERGAYLINKAFSNNQNRIILPEIRHGLERLKLVQEELNRLVNDVIVSSSINSLRVEDLNGLSFDFIDGVEGSVMFALVHEDYPDLVFKILQPESHNTTKYKQLGVENIFEEIIEPGVALASRIPEFIPKTRIFKAVDCNIPFYSGTHDLLVQEKVIPVRDILEQSDDEQQIKNIIDAFFRLQREMWARGIFDKDARLLDNYGFDPRTNELLVFDFSSFVDKVDTVRAYSHFGFASDINYLNLGKLGDYYQSRVPGLVEFESLWASKENANFESTKPDIKGGVDFEEISLDVASSDLVIDFTGVDLHSIEKFIFSIMSLTEIKDIENEFSGDVNVGKS